MPKITIEVGEELFRFHSEQEWINKAQSWFSNFPKDIGICVDSVGRICTIGKHFMRATKESTYPIIVYVKLV